MAVTGAEILVRSLGDHGVDRLFCVPGESYLAALDALHDCPGIDLVTCRHEGGAGYMAVADAKLTGRPGVCFVSRGPGATNAAIAVHTAEQDAVPLVLLVGQVAREERGRGAFQEVDYGKTFADMAKWVFEVHDPARLSEVLARAFHVAATSTPGPVVVVLPEDVLSESLAQPPAPVAALPLCLTAPGERDVGAVAAQIATAKRPLLIAGGGLDATKGRAALLAAAEAFGLPVALSFRRQDLFPNRHPLYAGHLGFKIPKPQVALLSEADLILAVGTRLGDVTTQGYTLPNAPKPKQCLIHIHSDPAQIGRVFRTDLGLVADPVAFLAALAKAGTPATPEQAAWAMRLHDHVTGMMHWQAPQAADGVVFGAVVKVLADRLPQDAMIILDAGNFSGWVHRHFPFGGDQRLLGAVSGAMGFAAPAAVAAGLRLPGRQIVTCIGDGGFLMTGNELATAVQRKVPVRYIVSNNQSYGTIRLHQERDYPGRVVGTDLANPDFAALGRAFGAAGFTIATDRDVEPVLAEALAAPGPVVVEVKASLEHVSAFATIAELRNRGR